MGGGGDDLREGEGVECSAPGERQRLHTEAEERRRVVQIVQCRQAERHEVR